MEVFPSNPGIAHTHAYIDFKPGRVLNVRIYDQGNNPADFASLEFLDLLMFFFF